MNLLVFYVTAMLLLLCCQVSLLCFYPVSTSALVYSLLLVVFVQCGKLIGFRVLP